ncbi:MAG TPA: GNAT family N-acetyltransferase [Euzebyales bacterium]|nr:GNAT family N-acetyltransferase [Euzebyales bacterium]
MTGGETIETSLRDGTRVLIRMVDPDDREQFIEGFQRLSTRSRYLRFHSAIEELDDRQLDYLTRVDQVNHVAWVAIDLDHPEHPGIGVARFVRLHDEPTVAEAAVTVLDAYQGRGLGTILLAALADAARERGITTFRAYVLGENLAMLAVLDRLGPIRTERQRGVYQIDVDLTDGEREPAKSMAGKVFHAVTGKHLPAMHTTAPPVWLSDDSGGTARRVLHQWLDRLLPGAADAERSDDEP